MEVDEELGFGDVGLGAAGLELVFEEREDGFARADVGMRGAQAVVGEVRSVLARRRFQKARTHLFE